MIYSLPSSKIRVLTSIDDFKRINDLFPEPLLEKYSDHRVIVKTMYLVTIGVPHHCDCEYCDYEGTDDEEYAFDNMEDLEDVLADSAYKGDCSVDDLEYKDPIVTYAAALIPQFPAETTPLFRPASATENPLRIAFIS